MNNLVIHRNLTKICEEFNSTNEKARISLKSTPVIVVKWLELFISGVIMKFCGILVCYEQGFK